MTAGDYGGPQFYPYNLIYDLRKTVFVFGYTFILHTVPTGYN